MIIGGKDRISRRRFLNRVAGGSALAPFVPWLDAHAESKPPKRLVVFHSPDGITSQFDRWRPRGTTTDFTMAAGDILGPLMANRSDIVVIEGLTNDLGITERGVLGHFEAGSTLLTGRQPILPQGADSVDMRATGISVDQYIANELARRGSTARFKSKQLGVQVTPVSSARLGLANGCISHTGPLQPLFPENSPQAAFKMFSGVGDTMVTMADGIARRKASILDVVKGDLNRLKARLGAADKAKMDNHLEAILQLERAIKSAAVTSGCKVPPAPPADTSIAGDLRNQMDLIAAALACNLTPVFTLQLGNSQWDRNFSWLPSLAGLPDNVRNADHHGLTHMLGGPTTAEGMKATIEINRWTAQQFAYFINKLKEYAETGGPSGTLFDNVAVAWLNEYSDGAMHQAAPVPPDRPYGFMPVVLAGGAGGGWKTGRFIRYPTTNLKPHNDLLVTLCNAMGIDDATFGDPTVCTGPLPSWG